ncbi:MAG TPA: hypothetical protein VFL38_06305 [Humibacillus xanthopallidus]|nr:hypothetical protein [Humibacillus xanthopallidus]
MIDSRKGPAVLLAAGAVLAALARQLVALLEPGGWSWTALLQDLVTNVLLAALLGLLVEGVRQLARQRAAARFVRRTGPLIQRAVLAWTGRLTVDTAKVSSADTQRKLRAAVTTLSTIAEGLRQWARLGPSREPGLPAPTVSLTLRELERYVKNGGRGRRAVYARALLTELAAARVDGDESLANAVSAFTWHATDWLAMLERTDAAVRVIATETEVTRLSPVEPGVGGSEKPSRRGAGDPQLAMDLAAGTDPVVALLRFLGDSPPASPGDWAPTHRDAVQALREEADAGALCVKDLQLLLEAATTPDVAATASRVQVP